jgi:hypothetical protein
MTNKEIENKRNKLIQIVNMPSGTEGPRLNKLRELALEVGASHKSVRGIETAKEAELVVGIQDALQTASMINACKIASRNFWIALIATMAAVISAIAAWAAVIKK